MKSLLKNNIIIIVILVAAGAAAVVPDIGTYLKALGLISPLIALVFVCQGMLVDTKELRGTGNHVRVLILGFFISHILAPIGAVVAVRLWGLQADDAVGFILICVMAPTLASGIVIATQAGGDRTTAIMLTVALNLISVLTIPINLKWTLGTTVEIDSGAMLLKLVLLVLVPALLGNMLRRFIGAQIARHKGVIGFIPVLCLGSIFFIAVSHDVDRLRDVSVSHVFRIMVPSLLLHLLLLVICFWCARKVFGLQDKYSRTLAILCSQKTLPLALAIWSASFVDRYPLAVLALLVFHFTQIVCDSGIAAWWSRRT